MEMKKDAHTHHISQKYNDELEELKNQFLIMGGMVERQVVDAVNALTEADSALAGKVAKTEREINQKERSLDEECTRILARRQPTASDLRLIVAVNKTTTDLERVGDEAHKVAKLAIKLAEEGEAPRGYVEIRHIGAHVSRMLHEALDSFARNDVEIALRVAQEDKSVDLEYESAMRQLVTFMMEDPRSISRVLNIIWALRSLERVGDHARNIAEQVIYLVKGQDVRHIPIDVMEQKIYE